MITFPRVLVLLYFLVIFILAPTTILSFDSYYYWDWSRHLALSYYDGSPMIAYLIKISTAVFGDCLFALALVGVVATAVTSIIVYRTSRLLLNPDASFIAMGLWLFSPLVCLDLLKQTTYDAPLTVFWALTVYSASKYIKFTKILDLYFTAVYIGLMLLAKYSGIVLVIALFIFLSTTKYRSLFKSYHLYLAMGCSLLIFSPVIIWNSQHAWQSFLYQLNAHNLPNDNNFLTNISLSLVNVFFTALNFLLIVPWLCWLKLRERQQDLSSNNSHYVFTPPAITSNGPTPMPCSSLKSPHDFQPHKLYFASCKSMKHSGNCGANYNYSTLYLWMVICLTFLGFYLFTAGKAVIRADWLAPYLITGAILAGFCYQELNYRKLSFSLLNIYIIISFCIILNAHYNFIWSNKLVYYNLLQQFNLSYPKIPKIVITTGWFEARMLFFLHNKPLIYTFNCGSQQNQYALWSKAVRESIINKAIKEILYIDIFDRSNCLARYFDQCTYLPLLSPLNTYPVKNTAIYAYKCSNKF